MSAHNRRIYMPPRNIVGSLLPLAIVTWYFLDKLGPGQVLVKMLLIATAVAIQFLVVVLSSRTRETRRPLLWRIYDLLTGNGRLPLRLAVSALVTITAFAVGFEISGVRSSNGNPSSFVIRFVEIDMYWSALNFMGVSDNSIEAHGVGKFLTVLATVSGLLFWGMYISILVNKHLEVQQLLRSTPSRDEIDRVHYDEETDK